MEFMNNIYYSLFTNFAAQKEQNCILNTKGVKL